jgi:hypothetical protein
MPSIRAVAQQVTPKLFGYVREGILDLLNLEADVRERLGKLRVLDVTPLHMTMKGVLTGDVADTDQLGFESDPYPRMDPQLTLDELTYQPDGRLTVSPRYTYTVRIAPGIQFTLSETAVAIGLNDPAGFEATGPSSTRTEAFFVTETSARDGLVVRK